MTSGRSVNGVERPVDDGALEVEPYVGFVQIFSVRAIKGRHRLYVSVVSLIYFKKEDVN